MTHTEKCNRLDRSRLNRDYGYASEESFVRKELKWVLFVAYCVFLLWMTLLSRTPRTTERVFKWKLFWAYRAWLAGVPDGKTESIQNINNILVFIPFGVFFTGKRWKWLLLTAFLLSAGIEAVQFAFNLGWCEIDDVICNVLGAAIGFRALKWIKGKFDAVGEKT